MVLHRLLECSDLGHAGPTLRCPSATNCRPTATRRPEFAPFWRALFGPEPVTVIV